MITDKLKSEFLPPLTPEDFYVLLAHATGRSKEFLLAHPEYGLDTRTENRVREFFARRIAHEPVAYIVGVKEFYGLPFHVTCDTLIPRPETETLVERAIEECRLKNADWKSKPDKKILVADIGTGSGAIIISLAHALRKDAGYRIQDTRYDLHAIDISKAALAVAKENAKRNDVADMIAFHEGSLIGPVKKYFDEADGIILIANLPYLSVNIYSSADEDIRRYEPERALLSGDDGLDHYRALFASVAKTIPALPSYRLSAFCEISPEQDALITGLFDSMFPQGESHILSDLSGRSRVLSFRLGKR
jgi:release factor glutamine methyltransferase